MAGVDRCRAFVVAGAGKHIAAAVAGRLDRGRPPGRHRAGQHGAGVALQAGAGRRGARVGSGQDLVAAPATSGQHAVAVLGAGHSGAAARRGHAPPARARRPVVRPARRRHGGRRRLEPVRALRELRPVPSRRLDARRVCAGASSRRDRFRLAAGPCRHAGAGAQARIPGAGHGVRHLAHPDRLVRDPGGHPPGPGLRLVRPVCADDDRHDGSGHGAGHAVAVEPVARVGGCRAGRAADRADGGQHLVPAPPLRPGRAFSRRRPARARRGNPDPALRHGLPVGASSGCQCAVRRQPAVGHRPDLRPGRTGLAPG